jgi:hypothetical protein
MKEDLIMSLAGNITMVMFLSCLFGVLIGWFFTHLYHISEKSKEDDDEHVRSIEWPPRTPEPLKRYRSRLRFINVENAGDNSTLNRTVIDLEMDGYVYNPEKSVAGVLAFEKLEEAPEAEGPNELTDAEIERLRRETKKIKEEYEQRKQKYYGILR